MTNEGSYRHVDYLWEDEFANQLDPVERLVYRSNKLGSDQRIVNTGGGNTSSKLTMPDPLTGEEVEVLWVKGSGGDLRTSTRENFASLYMERLESLKVIYDRSPVKGVDLHNLYARLPEDFATGHLLKHLVRDSVCPRIPMVDRQAHELAL